MNKQLVEFPVLFTGRLLLRRATYDDADGMFLLRSDEHVNRFIDRPLAGERSEAVAFIETLDNNLANGTGINWMICLQSDPAIVGNICLWNFSADKTIAELGYAMLTKYEGAGIMREAMQAVTHYAFSQMDIQKIEAFTHKDNVRSIRLLEKSEFVWEPGRTDKDNSNNVIYSLLRS